MRKLHSWAFPLFPGKAKVDFADLEEHAGVSRLRPFYKLGNSYIHAGPHALSLNIHTDVVSGKKSINSGATVFGDIAETCHGAMISVHQATASLVVAHLKADGPGAVDLLVGLKAQQRFVQDAADVWGRAADKARAWLVHPHSDR
jgi:hypothetical protein